MTANYLMHTIDSTTRTAKRQQSTGRAGTVLVLLVVISASAFLIWAENHLGWVQ